DAISIAGTTRMDPDTPVGLSSLDKPGTRKCAPPDLDLSSFLSILPGSIGDGATRRILVALPTPRGPMPRLQFKSFAAPDQERQFPRGSAQVVEIGEATIGLARWEPGWRWSTDLRPLVGG